MSTMTHNLYDEVIIDVIGNHGSELSRCETLLPVWKQDLLHLGPLGVVTRLLDFHFSPHSQTEVEV